MNTCKNKMEETKSQEKEGHTFILAWLEANLWSPTDIILG